MTTTSDYETASKASFYPYEVEAAHMVLQRLNDLDKDLPGDSYVASGELLLESSGTGEPWGRVWWDGESECWRLERITTP